MEHFSETHLHLLCLLHTNNLPFLSHRVLANTRLLMAMQCCDITVTGYMNQQLTGKVEGNMAALIHSLTQTSCLVEMFPLSGPPLTASNASEGTRECFERGALTDSPVGAPGEKGVGGMPFLLNFSFSKS